MTKIRITHNLPEVQKTLQEIARKSGSMSPALKVMGMTLEKSTRDRFDSQGPAPDGSAWAPLKPGTVARKREKNKPAAILREEDNLRDHINNRVEGDHTLLVGSPEKYAAIQQLGGDIPGRIISARKKKALRIPGVGFRKRVKWPGAHIPARPFLGISRQDEADLLEDAGHYLLD